MGEGEWLLRRLGGDDYSHLLRLLDNGEKFVNVELADGSKKLKAEAAPDHCSGRQRPLFILVEPLQSASDDQPKVLWHVDLINLNVSAELAGGIEDFRFFDQMPVHLLDEEWISLAFLKDETHQTLRNILALA